jgi:hypothetical protein
MMKKQYFLILLFLVFSKTYAQIPIQEAYVSKTYLNVDDQWTEVNFSAIVDIFSNRLGQLKISNAEFLTDLSGGKATMLAESAYITAQFESQTLVKAKIEKNGLELLTYQGKLVYKTYSGTYTPEVKITFTLNKADIIALRIINSENRKEYIFELEIKN